MAKFSALLDSVEHAKLNFSRADARVRRRHVKGKGVDSFERLDASLAGDSWAAKQFENYCTYIMVASRTLELDG